MILAEDLWLRGKAAQASMMQLWAYNTAFAGTATLQAWKMGLSAPAGFWHAVGRASAANGASAAKATKPAATAPKRKAAPKPAAQPALDVTTEPAAKPPLKVVAKAPATPRAAARIAVSIAPKPAAKSTAKAEPKAAARPARAVKVVPAPAPAPEAQGPSPHLLDAPRGGKADDLTSLKGVGAKLASALNEFGIYHYDQIARLDTEGVEWLDEQQKGFKMLAARYGLVEQAKARLS